MGSDKKWYLCKLKPEGEYFLGGERTFDFHGEGGKKTEEKNDYYIRSERFPSQSTLLGMLRFLVLKKEGRLSDDGVPAKDTKELIGEKSFEITGEEELSFGLIESLSPLMLMYHKDKEYHRLIRTPFNHSKGEVYNPFTMQGPYKTELGNKTWLPEGYDAKKGMADNFLDIDDENRIIDSTSDRRIFEYHVHTRNKKGAEKNSFFKKEYLTLHKDFEFAFYCQVEEDRLPDKTIVYIGQDKSVFSFSAVVCENDPREDIKEKIRHMKRPDSLPKEVKVYYALSDALLDDKKQGCYSMTRKKWFRSMITQNDNSYRNRRRKSKLFQLIEAGSVMFSDSTDIMEQTQTVIEKNLKKIGLNILVEIGGQDNE